nr:reverse transcriptase domain-containing protein [Tanacetum cinerariifolium]
MPPDDGGTRKRYLEDDFRRVPVAHPKGTQGIPALSDLEAPPSVVSYVPTNPGWKGERMVREPLGRKHRRMGGTRPEVMKISSFMDAHKCPKLAKRYSDKVAKTMDEMMTRLDKFVKSKEAFTSTELPKGEALEVFKKVTGSIGKREDGFTEGAPYQEHKDQGPQHLRVNLNSLTKLPNEILASKLQLNMQPPRPMQLPSKKENQEKYCTIMEKMDITPTITSSYK